MRKIGFTGTQEGMTDQQRFRFVNHIQRDYHKNNVGLIISEAHHGDCIGADEQFDEIMREFGVPIHIHPPVIQSKRAFTTGWMDERDVIYPPKPYLDRNHDIVDMTDELFATPKTRTEELRSGTWSTVRYAKKMGKKVTIIYPDGSVEVLNGKET